MSFLKSAKAKAELASDLAKDHAAHSAQANSPIQTRKDIRGFWVQHPKSRDLFGAIYKTWRKASATRPGHAGYWAAYPYPWWSELTGIPVATLKRHLDRLEQLGLIERERGKFGGNRVLTFIRPTILGLRLSNPKSQDWQHLGHDPNTPPNGPAQSVKPSIAHKVAGPQPPDEKPLSMAELLAMEEAEKPLTLAEVQAILAEDD